MKFSRILFLLIAATALSIAPEAVETAQAANNTNLSRTQIRSMPITQRPSRIGHFYGNAVRRAYYRRTGR